MGLPISTDWKSDSYDSILVIIDRLTKMMYYEPVKVTINASGLAEVILDVVVRYHGLPDSIVLDRGSLFTSKFWSWLCYILSIKRRLLTAFHPQTNNQTEQQNSTIEAYLWSFVNFKWNNWAKLLLMAKFAYNNAKNVSNVHTPFELNCGYHSWMLYKEKVDHRSKSKSVDKLSAKLRKLMIVCQENLYHAQKFWKRAHDKGVQPRSYSLGDKVWLNSKYIKIKQNQKLEAKFFGLFRVLYPVRKQAYKLELPRKWRIHDVFHVSLLEKDTTRKRRVDEEVKQIEFDKGDNESRKYEVEVIWDNAVYTRESKSGHLSSLYYLVSWKGYPKEENTWEPASVVGHLRKLINSFHKDYPDTLTATTPAIDTTPPMARPTIRATVKSSEPPKQKQGWPVNNTNKQAKKNWLPLIFIVFLDEFGYLPLLTSSAALHVTARDAHDYTWMQMTSSQPSSKHLLFDFQVLYLHQLPRPCKPHA